MKKMFLALGVVALLFANEISARSDYQLEITPVFGGVLPREGNLHLENQIFYGARIATNLDYSWFDQTEFAFDLTPDAKLATKNKQRSRIYRGYLNFIKLVPTSKDFAFYGLIGAGGEKAQLSKDIASGFMANYGAGLKYHLSDQLALKAEIRHGMKLNMTNKTDYYANHNLFYSVGFSYAFWQKANATKMQKPIVIQEKKPIVKPVIKDEDKDGVLDNMDECPSTPKGVPVEENGCPKRISLHIKFTHNSTQIPEKYNSDIDKVANFMIKYPAFSVMIEGYSDSRGSENYNLKLSDKRAEAVAKYLIKKGVNADKISTVGYGEANPVESNMLEAGREKNRRVEAVFSY